MRIFSLLFLVFNLASSLSADKFQCDVFGSIQEMPFEIDLMVNTETQPYFSQDHLGYRFELDSKDNRLRFAIYKEIDSSTYEEVTIARGHHVSGTIFLENEQGLLDFGCWKED